MDVSRAVEEFRRDRKAGATALARRALEIFAASRGRAAAALSGARPAMPLIAAVVGLARKEGAAPALRALERAEAGLLKQAEDVLPPGARYRVYGGSGTVAVAVRHVGGRVVESGPCDVGLVGADALLPDGDFVNAKGTSDFLREVRGLRAGCFAVAVELKRVEEVPVLGRGLERVPARLVHAVLTEAGLRYPPMGTLAGPVPTWVDRGGLEHGGSQGLCHPHHGPDHAGTSIKRRPARG
jgi:hypothetical protein